MASTLRVTIERRKGGNGWQYRAVVLDALGGYILRYPWRHERHMANYDKSTALYIMAKCS